HVIGGWNASDQIEVDAAEELFVRGQAGGWHALGDQLVKDGLVDEIAPGNSRSRLRCRGGGSRKHAVELVRAIRDSAAYAALPRQEIVAVAGKVAVSDRDGSLPGVQISYAREHKRDTQQGGADSDPIFPH